MPDQSPRLPLLSRFCHKTSLHFPFDIITGSDTFQEKASARPLIPTMYLSVRLSGPYDMHPETERLSHSNSSLIEFYPRRLPDYW